MFFYHGHLLEYDYHHAFDGFDQEGSGGGIEKGKLEDRMDQTTGSLIYQRQSGVVDSIW